MSELGDALIGMAHEANRLNDRLDEALNRIVELEDEVRDAEKKLRDAELRIEQLELDADSYDDDRLCELINDVRRGIRDLDELYAEALGA